LGSLALAWLGIQDSSGAMGRRSLGACEQSAYEAAVASVTTGWLQQPVVSAVFSGVLRLGFVGHSSGNENSFEFDFNKIHDLSHIRQNFSRSEIFQ
jgi:hypothetical protein